MILPNLADRIVPRLFFAFLLLSILPLAGLSWLHLKAFERSLQETALGNLAAIADKKVDQINAYINERIADNQSLARLAVPRAALLASAEGGSGGEIRSIVLSGTRIDLTEFFARLIDGNDFHDLLLVDIAGNVVFSVLGEADLGTNLNHGPYRTSLLAHAHRDALALLDTQVTTAGPYEPSGDKPAIFFVTPILDAGSKPLGSLVLQLDMAKLTLVADDRTGLGETGETVLAQRTGDQALYVGPLRHIPDAAFRRIVPIEATPPPMRAGLSGEHGRGITYDYVSRPVVAAWRHLPALNWSMVVKMDVEEAFASLHTLRHYSLLALLSLLLLALAGALLFGRELVMPIRRLVAATERLANGDLRERAPGIGYSEYRELADSFNRMADRLAEEQAVLEDRVQERTEALAKSEALLNQAQAVARIGSWHLDLTQNRLTWSDETCRMFDTPNGQPLAYEDFIERVHPDDRQAVNEAWQAALQGAPYDFTHRIVVRDETRWVREMAEFSFAADGSLSSATGTVQDITEQVRSSAEYQAILRAALDGFWITDLEGRFVEVNDAYCRMVGYSREEVLKMRIPDVEASENPEETRAHIEKILATGSDRFETRHRHRDGHPIDIEVSVNYLKIGGGRLVVFLRDISERKQAELELIEARRIAEAANRAKSEFLANMSHEIRTPMNAILGLTQLVLETPLAPQQADFLKKTLVSGRALLGILNDILDYSKIEAGRLEIEQTRFAVEEVLREIADLFSAQVAEKGLELLFDIDPGLPPTVIGDPLRLRQVLSNLLGNAIKFTERGVIQVRVEALPANGNPDRLTLRFAVHDTGIGIDKEIAGRLFQPFTQADGSITRKYGGTGLGLAICHSLVTLMGGEIAASGEPGHGATFGFTIAVGRGDRETPAPDLQRVAGMRVLVVDDQESARAILQRLLTAWGIACDTAADGKTALDMIAAAHANKDGYCALLLDWQMPDIDGIEVVRRIAADPQRYGVSMKVMMVTAHDRQKLLEQAGDLPLENVLTKPVTPSLVFDALIGRIPVPATPESHVRQKSALAGRRFDGARVLIVEDNPFNQQVAAGFLDKLGVAVTLADNGSQALAIAANADFDIVLMDLHMPVMDGLEATRRLRTLPRSQGTPVVAMTAAVMEEDRQRCRDAGMIDFVPKPIDPDQLVGVLEKYLPATAAARLDEPLPTGPLPGLPGFDLPAALRRMGGDRALLVRLLHDFAIAQREFSSGLTAALNEEQWHEAVRRLHTLKGVAANLGAVDVAEAARLFETEVRAGNRAAFLSFSDRLRAAIEAAGRAIASLETQLAQAAPPDRAIIESLLQRLRPYLEERELLPDELLQELSPLAHSGLPGAPFATLLRQIDDFDHDGALATLAQIAARFDINLGP